MPNFCWLSSHISIPSRDECYNGPLHFIPLFAIYWSRLCRWILLVVLIGETGRCLGNRRFVVRIAKARRKPIVHARWRWRYGCDGGIVVTTATIVGLGGGYGRYGSGWDGGLVGSKFDRELGARSKAGRHDNGVQSTIRCLNVDGLARRYTIGKSNCREMNSEPRMDSIVRNRDLEQSRSSMETVRRVANEPSMYSGVAAPVTG
jgi:hypothetical protein